MRAKLGLGARSTCVTLGHRQARRVDAVDARGGQQVADLHVGVAGHEAQLHAGAAGDAAEGRAAHLRARVQHRDRGVLVGQQRDLGDERVDARHLAEHAGLVDHRRAEQRRRCVPPRSMTTLREYGIGRLVQHLGGHASAR